MGCLTFPFRLLGFLLLLLLLLAGWLYRDWLLEWGRRATGAQPPAAAVGTPSPAALARARSALQRLQQGRADSVVLDADASASLMAQAMGPLVADQLDSLRVSLGSGRLGVDASLRTARLPRELLGPLAIAVRSREPVSAAGAVRVTGPGRAEWEIDRASIRDIPLPREAMPRLLGRAFGDTARRALPLLLPAGVQDLQIRPNGVTLYGREAR